MEIDFLDDGELPIGTPSIRQCAAMLALENAGIQSGDDPTVIEALWDLPPHALEEVDFPRGRLARLRDELESAMSRDLDAGRITARRVRRSPDGSIVASETLLSLDVLEEWATSYGLELGDTYAAYADGEGDAASAALEAIKATRWRLVDPKGAAEARRLAARFSEAEVVALFLENQRLRNGAVAETEKPLNPRERNNLLRIIRALTVMTKLPARGGATSVVAQLEAMGFDGPREDKVRSVIDEARKHEP